MKCYNCEKMAMFAVGPEGQDAPLCLDCYIRFQNVMLQRQEMLERQANYLTAQIESVAGFPGILPRFPERRVIVHTGGLTLNNIRVTNSEIGVLNTGTIENVDASLTVLKSEGNAELATAVTALSQGVIKSAELATEQKNEIVEFLFALLQEAIAPKEKRKISLVRILLGKLNEILTDVQTVVGLWETARAIFDQVFAI